MKGNCFDRTAQQISRKFNLHRHAVWIAGIIFVMLFSPSSLPAGQYDLKGSIEAAKQEEARLRSEAADAEERMYAQSKKLFEQLTDPDGKFKLSREQAIKILRAKGFLVDRL